MENLRRHSWYLGELNDDIAASTLKDTGGANTFVVYKNTEKDALIIALRLGEGGGVFETRVISDREGSCQITGESDVYPDVITAVMRFAESHKLSPAFDGRNVAQPLISSLDAPPSYSQAERALVPDVAPLPTIDEIEKDASNEVLESAPIDHRHYYRSLHRCHPKNVCHYCWYSDGEHWLFPWAKGPLRAGCTIFMWALLFFFCCPCTCLFALFLHMMRHVNFC